MMCFKQVFGDLDHNSTVENMKIQSCKHFLMDPEPDFHIRIRISSQSGSGLRKKIPIRIRTKGSRSETLPVDNRTMENSVINFT